MLPISAERRLYDLLGTIGFIRGLECTSRLNTAEEQQKEEEKE